ncbi:MAG: hypothetical protein GY758_08480 [Fuerstiella sp.]|jgi:hypothetical protein|nr:hypothetical protein [Fuerstiella sp.]MCP4507229.1 hypothetical protein [Fuerstiella sp.]
MQVKLSLNFRGSTEAAITAVAMSYSFCGLLTTVLPTLLAVIVLNSVCGSADDVPHQPVPAKITRRCWRDK